MPLKFLDKKSQRRALETIRSREEERAAEETAKRYNLPYENLIFTPVQSEAIKTVPEKEAREAMLAVTAKKGQALYIAVSDPDKLEAKNIIEELKKTFREVLVFVVSQKSLEKAWKNYPKRADQKEISGSIEISQKIIEGLKEKISSIASLKKAIADMSEQKDTSIILEVLLAGAMALGASDIHIEAQKEEIRLRLRIDGILSDIQKFNEHIYKLLLSRIKLLSGMKLNLHNIAQDGRFSVRPGGEEMQIRASVLPGEYGENIVLRVLNPSSLLSIEELGIRKDLINQIERELKKPNGMILTTGPTGSGKTTTLYAFLKRIHSPEIKIITIEDPIEYHLKGVSQTQVVPEKGYTFASGLRSVLRQDPDIILIGEIRDLETADTALQAALTGHLVLSTLHTNDAAGVIPRLVDLGANPATIGPALNMAMAQRLVRKVCKACSDKREASKEELEKLKKELGDKVKSGIKLTRANACGQCNNTGYKGRIGIYEIIIVTAEFEKFILTNPSITEIREFAKERGVTTLKQDGFLKLLDGITTIEEVERVMGE